MERTIGVHTRVYCRAYSAAQTWVHSQWTATLGPQWEFTFDASAQDTWVSHWSPSGALQWNLTLESMLDHPQWNSTEETVQSTAQSLQEPQFRFDGNKLASETAVIFSWSLEKLFPFWDLTWLRTMKMNIAKPLYVFSKKKKNEKNMSILFWCYFFPSETKSTHK